MTTTTTFQGMEPGAKNSSRVLRPPGGASNLSFGTDEEKPVRKNKMASNIFAEPDDPHAHRRNNPPGGEASGILCGEPSAPLRRCHNPPVTQNNSAAEQATTVDEIHEQANDEHVEEPEAVPEQREEAPQPSVPSSAGGAPGGRRNPPGGKSSLVLG